MVFGSRAFSILRAAKAHNGFQHRLIAHSTHSRMIYSQTSTSASRDWTRLALSRPFASHSDKEEAGDVVDPSKEANKDGVKKVHKFFVLPCHGQKGGLTLTDLKAEIAKLYDLADKFSYRSFFNRFNSITATLTEDQVELIKKSLKVISVMDDSGLVLIQRM